MHIDTSYGYKYHLQHYSWLLGSIWYCSSSHSFGGLCTLHVFLQTSVQIRCQLMVICDYVGLYFIVGKPYCCFWSQLWFFIKPKVSFYSFQIILPHDDDDSSFSSPWLQIHTYHCIVRILNHHINHWHGSLWCFRNNNLILNLLLLSDSFP